jgi:dTDP-4-dehydrorhamnose 3,5-epimerase
MSFEPLPGLPDVVLIRPDLFPDRRGLFLELLQERKLEAAGLPGRFVQANLSVSKHGVLRGLHFQNPQPQGKLISVVRGEIFDVVTDIRTGSPTFGAALGVRLSAAERTQLFVPADFAHGFLVLSDGADVIYHCTDFYRPDAEHTLLWNDPALGIAWPALDGLEAGPLLADKDARGLTLAQLEAAGRLPRYGP